MKVVINKCHGGFGISDEGYDWLIKNKNWKVTEFLKDGYGYKDKTADLVLNDDYKKYKSFRSKYYFIRDTDENSFRTDLDLIEAVETLGKKANGQFASLAIIEIPDNVDWEIGEYDGAEWVQEIHRRWS
jgi:hypothetical protein